MLVPPLAIGNIVQLLQLVEAESQTKPIVKPLAQVSYAGRLAINWFADCRRSSRYGM